GYGIVYSPYHSDGTCKSADQVNTDFESIDGDYGLVRIYGTDCNQTYNVLPAVVDKGLKLFAGVYDITQLDSELAILIDSFKNNWDAIHTVSVGNEGVQMGTYTVDDVVAAVKNTRSTLKDAGYNGNVVTVDTAGMVIAYPALCEVSDFAAANCHGFFNSDLDASGAGGWVLSQAQDVSAACGGKETWITESGWPWQGSANGKAVPSPENQSSAIASLKQSFSSNIILFTAFNDLWKKDNAYTFGAEKYWG
ncbi:glycoside hydrolase family 17 protein, partial [Polychaeton citri CBS 116435]